MLSAPVTAGLVALLSGAAQAQYTLDTKYDASNFMNEFTFFAEEDPTHGFVEYVDQATAMSLGLAGTENNVIHMGVDSTTMNPPNGRQSVRVSSNKAFNHGLFIGDFSHMPGSICGAWPAFWLFGPEWPTSGEIDIVEGVNNQDATAITLHTSPGCTVTNEGTDPGTTLKSGDCGQGEGYTGCGQETSNIENYGDGFNAIQGGVYAMEWTSEHIAVWFFPRYAIPQDITNGTPDPATWAQPSARFVGGSGCNLDDFFVDNNIIFDTTFCGDWAGKPEVWDTNEECAALAPTCDEYVGNNPSAFTEAYWSVNSVTVYQKGSNSTATPPAKRHSLNFNA